MLARTRRDTIASRVASALEAIQDPGWSALSYWPAGATKAAMPQAACNQGMP
jgi:hypothetical protein